MARGLSGAVQIDTNTTGMAAGLHVVTDKEAWDHCVATVKGTFTVDGDGAVRLAEEQEPLVYADVHLGDPGATSIRYGCDFAPPKPFVDVLVNGSAHAPGGRPVERMVVGLAVAGVRKGAVIWGDRYWYEGSLGAWTATPPRPFTAMPLVWERAFGGVDATHADVERRGAELRNLVGRGFRLNGDRAALEHAPLPNIEAPDAAVTSWADRPPPAGFNVVGRGWQPRLRYGGTYDQRWLDERFPFLPDDFDDRYNQCAPEDQWAAALAGGEALRCTGMTPEGPFDATVPRVEVPVTFVYNDRREQARGRIDTLIVEPDRRRLIVVWRAATRVGRKLHALREVVVGAVAARRFTAATTPAEMAGAGKPHFASLGEYVAWRRRWNP